MCAVCRQYPCHSRCPNAPEPEPIKICCQCEGGLFEGEKYFKSPDGPICEECLHDMNGTDLLEMLGETMKTVESEV